MLNDDQWLELYTSSVENRKDLIYIKEAVEHHNTQIEDCSKRINVIEVDQGFRKGKVAYLAVMLSAVITVLVNGILWSFSFFGGSK